jgi:Spy/CpxP family protein refolding chaperone
MISIDMTKAKDIAHEKRRAARTTEFAPLDIKATIPSEAAAAEAARQAIREKYDTLQAQMDAAQTPEQLKALLPEAKFVEIK